VTSFAAVTQFSASPRGITFGKQRPAWGDVPVLPPVSAYAPHHPLGPRDATANG